MCIICSVYMSPKGKRNLLSIFVLYTNFKLKPRNRTYLLLLIPTPTSNPLLDGPRCRNYHHNYPKLFCEKI